MIRRACALAVLLAVLVACSKTGDAGETSTATPPPGSSEPTPEQTRAIAKEAYVYGFPMVDNYRVMYSYFVDREDPEYKGNWNEIHNTARVYTPADTAIQTPNSDTPYSAVGADLRTEPLVLTVPPIEQNRYFSLQFVDLYTYNIAYVGSRTTGNGGGTYLLAGPGWQGNKPDGIDEVIRSDTDLAMVLYRTQLFGPDDRDNVKAIQAGYRVTPLSTFLNQPAPPPAPPIDFLPPLNREQQRTSPQFFDLLGFTLRFAPVVPAEQEMRTRFASVGIGPDASFDPDALDPAVRAAFEGGMADAWAEFDGLKKRLDAGEVNSADFFGTPADLKGNFLYRMAGAVLGIYGNTAAEAIYPSFMNDSAGAPMTGADRYTVTFAPEQLPPVNAFWSLTMYEMPQSLLVANPIDRYLVNSEMLPELARDPDGGLTIYVQHDAPTEAKQLPNWLPAPEGPFGLVMRLYWPKPDALDGSWKAPAPVKVTP